MGRHKQPELLARLKGADKKNPQRYRAKTPEAKTGLGGMPVLLSDEAKICWSELVRHSLAGVLTGADRQILEITANLLAEYRREPESFPVGKYVHLIGGLARLGMTPTDRQKLGTAPKQAANDFEDF